MMSVLRLFPQPPGKIVTGEVLFDGRDLPKISNDKIHQDHGNRIAMIFHDSITSLNPVFTTGHHIGEALDLHMGMVHFVACHSVKGKSIAARSLEDKDEC
jgi:ABC-type microcin C transport system duplicated ATPase subunit YejF